MKKSLLLLQVIWIIEEPERLKTFGTIAFNFRQLFINTLYNITIYGKLWDSFFNLSLLYRKWQKKLWLLGVHRAKHFRNLYYPREFLIICVYIDTFDEMKTPAVFCLRCTKSFNVYKWKSNLLHFMYSCTTVAIALKIDEFMFMSCLKTADRAWQLLSCRYRLSRPSFISFNRAAGGGGTSTRESCSYSFSQIRSPIRPALKDVFSYISTSGPVPVRKGRRHYHINSLVCLTTTT